MKEYALAIEEKGYRVRSIHPKPFNGLNGVILLALSAVYDNLHRDIESPHIWSAYQT